MGAILQTFRERSMLFFAFPTFDFYLFSFLNLLDMIRNKLRAIFNPDRFQGWGKKHNYFEGWYFKIVNKDETKAFAIIPGIAMDDQGKSHAFIQILDGKKETAQYHQFDTKSFIPSFEYFKINVGSNHFSRHSLRLNLPELKGKLQFSSIVRWPKHWYSPGIMGPYTFIPFMECYHGVVSLDHKIHGCLEVDGENVDFSNGRGYIEKDWGQSFPSAYVWLQTNHFSKPGISLKASVAKIPFLGNWFVGFIAGIWLGDRLIRFTTYNKSTLRKSVIDLEKVELVMENKKYRIEIRAKRKSTTTLASPINGFMNGRIEESMNSLIEVNLIDKKTGISIFNDIGRNAGLEVAGKIEEIIIV